MGTSLAGLLIVSVFVTSAITMWRVELMGIVLFADARKAATELEGEQARTKIDLITAGADPGTSILTVDVRNTGTISVSESDFPRMDVIVHYNGGVRASEAFTYTTSDPPGLGQWTDTSTSGQFETAIWNPDEILSVDIALGTPCDSGTVVIGTPNGINDTNVAPPRLQLQATTGTCTLRPAAFQGPSTMISNTTSPVMTPLPPSPQCLRQARRGV